MYVKRPLVMKNSNVVRDQDDVKKSIDAFLDMLIVSGKGSFKADDDFGFSLEDFRFEIYSPETRTFHHTKKNKKKDLLGSIEDPVHNYKITGSSINTETFANHLQNTIVRYEQRLKNVVVDMEFLQYGTILLINVTGVIDNGYDTPYSYFNKIKIW